MVALVRPRLLLGLESGVEPKQLPVVDRTTVPFEDGSHRRQDTGLPIDESAVAVERQVAEVFELDQRPASL